MSGDRQAFAEHGDPTEEGCCRWCGRTLRFERVIAGDSDKNDPTYEKIGPHYAVKRADKPGRYHDGEFCGLRCGYQFAVRLAQLGRRLRPLP